MSSPERVTASPKRALLWKLLSPVAGSSSPAYQQLDWRKTTAEQLQDMRGGDEVLFKKFHPAERAGPFPRTWHLLGVLAVPKDSLVEAKTAYPEAQEAVLVNGGKRGLLIGELPEGQSFGSDRRNADLLLHGLRIGKGALEATLGVRHDDYFIELDDVRTWATNTDSAFENIYPTARFS